MILYTKIHKNAYIEHLIGEFYLSLSEQAKQDAYKYFKLSLEKQIATYKYNEKKYGEKFKNQRQADFIAYMIGNAYECGKGTAKDLNAAKYWYKKAIHKNKYPQATVALDRVNNLINNLDNLEYND